MAKEKAPAFQFYPKEFLADGNVSAMTLAEIGAYMKLMCLCWNDESLPMATDRLANMVGVSRKQFDVLWPAVRVCFIERDGRYRHPRLDQERKKQTEHRQRQSDKGMAGAEKRWHRHSTGIGTGILRAIPNPCLAIALLSPISYLLSPSCTDWVRL
jgi:uncharacterized protein YdaU (DUF1376 family)